MYMYRMPNCTGKSRKPDDCRLITKCKYTEQKTFSFQFIVFNISLQGRILLEMVEEIENIFEEVLQSSSQPPWKVRTSL